MAETTFTDRQWYENFRVSRETFQYIVSEVIHEIRRQDTMFRKAVCPSTKVAILLYYLGSIAEYRTIANLFGVSKYFLSYKRGSSSYRKKAENIFPVCAKGEDLKEVMKIYREKWGFLHVRSNRRNTCAYSSSFRKTHRLCQPKIISQCGNASIGWCKVFVPRHCTGMALECSCKTYEFSQTQTFTIVDSRGHYLTTISQ